MGEGGVERGPRPELDRSGRAHSDPPCNEFQSRNFAFPSFAKQTCSHSTQPWMPVGEERNKKKHQWVGGWREGESISIRSACVPCRLPNDAENTRVKFNVTQQQADSWSPIQRPPNLMVGQPPPPTPPTLTHRERKHTRCVVWWILGFCCLVDEMDKQQYLF